MWSMFCKKYVLTSRDFVNVYCGRLLAAAIPQMPMTNHFMTHSDSAVASLQVVQCHALDAIFASKLSIKESGGASVS